MLCICTLVCPCHLSQDTLVRSTLQFFSWCFEAMVGNVVLIIQHKLKNNPTSNLQRLPSWRVTSWMRIVLFNCFLAFITLTIAASTRCFLSSSTYKTQVKIHYTVYNMHKGRLYLYRYFWLLWFLFWLMRPYWDQWYPHSIQFRRKRRVELEHMRWQNTLSLWFLCNAHHILYIAVSKVTLLKILYFGAANEIRCLFKSVSGMPVLSNIS